jgi:hypothetical protein
MVSITHLLVALLVEQNYGLGTPQKAIWRSFQKLWEGWTLPKGEFMKKMK